MSQVMKYPENQWRPECVICKKPVELEESKTDEYGQAIHEPCYVSKFTKLRKKKPTSVFRFDPPRPTGRHLTWSASMNNTAERGPCQRTARTLAIEAMLRDGRYSMMTIARAMGISRTRVGHIKARIDRSERALIFQTFKMQGHGR